MQCDPECSNYSPCVSTCPVETCDNVLDQGKDQRMCLEDSCVEGCKIKPCAENSIYLNDTYAECVPTSVCKPTCLEVNGVTYYEGDVMKSDNCQTCRCTRGKEVCSGVPCTTIKDIEWTTTAQPMHEEKLKCKSGWSAWMNQDKSDFQEIKGTKTKPKNKGFKTGDKEPLPSYFDMINFDGFAHCEDKSIASIECRSVGTHLEPKSTGQDVECALDRGLVCYGNCYDYEIRILCDCGDLPVTKKPIILSTTTTAPLKITKATTTRPYTTSEPKPVSTCDPSIPHVEFPGDCYKFLHCLPSTDNGWKYVEKTCGPTMMYNPVSMVCDWIASVVAFKAECGDMDVVTTRPFFVTKSPTIVYRRTTEQYFVPIIEENKPVTECDSSIPHVEFPGDCHKFLHCQPSADGGWKFVEKTCGDTMLFNPRAMVCDWIDTVLAFKPECGIKAVTIIPEKRKYFEEEIKSVII